MPRLLRCAQGHEWEPKDDTSALCPVCGQGEQTVTVTSRRTSTDSAGEGQETPPQLEDYEILDHRRWSIIDSRALACYSAARWPHPPNAKRSSATGP